MSFLLPPGASHPGGTVFQSLRSKSGPRAPCAEYGAWALSHASPCRPRSIRPSTAVHVLPLKMRCVTVIPPPDYFCPDLYTCFVAYTLLSLVLRRRLPWRHLAAMSTPASDTTSSPAGMPSLANTFGVLLVSIFVSFM